MSKHTHEECKHVELKHCAKCDTVECESCGKEWIKEFVNIPFSQISVTLFKVPTKITVTDEKKIPLKELHFFGTDPSRDTGHDYMFGDRTMA